MPKKVKALYLNLSIIIKMSYRKASDHKHADDTDQGRKERGGGESGGDCKLDVINP